jgi:hypothetical protein
MNPNLTKEQRQRIRALGAVAHERELSDALAKLESEFKGWRAGEVDAFEMAQKIHRFHQGPARELFSKYDHATLDLAVAQALHREILSQEEAGPLVMQALESTLAFLREQDARGAAQPDDAADRGPAEPRR